MKLGTETASLTNHIYSRAVKGQPEPMAGMGATILCWTDRHAATIVETWKGTNLRTFLIVREDYAKRTDQNGLSENQTWTFEPNPNGASHVFRQANDGTWEPVELNNRRWRKTGGPGLRIGEREEYRDPSF